ncbi:hypothetical protein [Microbacterium sp. ZXX196]|uniref:hypothetical protein n=1 Tax=Microbacterium sp. ZXX196 TaxID=2609291 RepID=UPI0018AD0E32|nr:hypothetical protein [Microbacterium sp. ZXX196]
MSTPQPYPQPDRPGAAGSSPILRGVMWVAIGALIASAIVCVVWVLLAPQGDVIPKAFLTILLLAGFAGAALLDASLAPGREPWLVLASMASWIVALLCGLALVWSPWDTFRAMLWVGNFVLIVVLLQLTLVHQRLLWRAHAKYVRTFTRILAVVTTALVVALLGMALVPLALPRAFDYPDIYGRIMVSLAILGAVGTALVPLITALFAPRAASVPPAPAAPTPVPAASTAQPAPAPASPVSAPPAAPAAAEPLPWPTYSDGATPLPMLPDGQPDFAAQATGVPTPGAREFGPAPQAAPHAPGAGAPHPAPPRPAPPA